MSRNQQLSSTGFFMPSRRLQNNISQLLMMIIEFYKKIWIAYELRFCVLALSMAKCQEIHLSEIFTKKLVFSVTISEKKIFYPEK